MVTTGNNQTIEIDPAKLEKAVVRYGVGSILNVSDQALPADKLAAKKDEIKHLRDVARYLARWDLIPDDAEPKVEIERIVKEHGWDKK